MELSGRIETQQHERVDFEDRQPAHARLATPEVKKKPMSGDFGPQSPVRPDSYRERRRLEHLALESQVNKKMVVERDTDLLTREELVKHRLEVIAAIVAELKTWLKYKCFCRSVWRRQF